MRTLLACGRGELFEKGPQLPLPPMLMFDRISEIAEDGGEYGKGLVRAELDVKPDLWFFPCHFKGDPVMPGCLGLDALWQIARLLPRLARRAGQGPRARHGRSQVLRPGASDHEEGRVRHRHQARDAPKLVLGIADGWLYADGSVIYRALDLKVGLFLDGAPQPSGA